MPGYQTVRSAEQWALHVLDRFSQRQWTEDGRVEFKQQLPEDPQKVARRIAGHANSARGESILWLVGVDERNGKVVYGQMPTDAAKYWSQVWSKFDGAHPELVDVQVEFEGVTVIALAFNCERVPYVVLTGLAAPKYEVPWREGTAVGTANRSQLIRLLLPMARVPQVEVRQVLNGDPVLAVTFFVVPPSADPVMMPVHRAILEWGSSLISASEVIGNGAMLTQPHPVLREAKGQGVYLYGPAEVVVRWPVGRRAAKEQCRARLTFEPGGIELFVTEGMPLR